MTTLAELCAEVFTARPRHRPRRFNENREFGVCELCGGYITRSLITSGDWWHLSHGSRVC